MTGKSTSGYETPEVTEYGSVEELTEQSNKVGSSEDQYTGTVPIVGSITAVQ